MNKHKLYRSDMGLEPNNDRKARYQKLKDDLQRMVDVFGLTDVLTELRLIAEEQNKER